MEVYVTELLKRCDLSVITKKHIRHEYKQHVGRELTVEEKTGINDLVYDYVRSLAVEQSAVVHEQEDKQISPGNKENVSANSSHTKDSPDHKTTPEHRKIPLKNTDLDKSKSRYIIRGQVVDKNDLYGKKKTADKPADRTVKENGKLSDVNSATISARVRRENFKAFQEKLNVSDVVKSVLESYDESSSSVSSLSDLELDSEADEQGNLQAALEKLQQARDKKIQMSIERKKTRNEKREASGGNSIKAKRGLDLKEDETEDNIDKREGDDRLKGKTDEDNTERASNHEIKRKNRVVKLSTDESDSDSGPVKVKKTPESYSKRKVKLKKRSDLKEKSKRKLISDSDADSEREELEEDRSKAKDIKFTRMRSFEFSDSDDEVLSAIAAKQSDKGKKSENSKTSKSKNSDTIKGQGSQKAGVNARKGTEELDSPVVKVKAKTAVNLDSDSDDDSLTNVKEKPHKSSAQKTSKASLSESDDSTGDTPLAKKKIVKRKAEKVDETVNENNEKAGDTSVAKKKQLSKTNAPNAKDDADDNDIDAKGAPKAKKETIKKQSHGRSDVKKERVEDPLSEESTDDTPLAKKKMDRRKDVVLIVTVSSSDDEPLALKRGNKSNVKAESDDDDAVVTPTNKPKTGKKRSKPESDSDNDATPTNKKRARKRSVEVVVCSDSDSSSGDKPLAKMKKKVNDKVKVGDRVNDKGKAGDKVNGKGKAGDKVNDKVKAGDKVNDKVKVGDKVKVNDKGDYNMPKVKIDSDSSIILISGADTQDSDDGNSDAGKGSKKRPVIISSENDSPVKKTKKGAKVNVVLSSESEMSDEEAELVKKIAATLDSDADSDWDLPLAKIQKLTKGTKYEERAEGNSQSQTPTGAQSGRQEESLSLRLLRKICRECRLFVRNDRELKDCNTDEEKVERCKELLRQAGMKGKPSLAKAEEVMLKKEAKELSAENIISSETGRVMRKVKSIYARRAISPQKPMRSPMKNPFSGISDIVDSEGSSPTKH